MKFNDRVFDIHENQLITLYRNHDVKEKTSSYKFFEILFPLMWSKLHILGNKDKVFTCDKIIFFDLFFLLKRIHFEWMLIHIDFFIHYFSFEPTLQKRENSFSLS